MSSKKHLEFVSEHRHSLILLCMCPDTTVYVSSYCYVCVLILLHMCPHTATYMSSYHCSCVLMFCFFCAGTRMTWPFYTAMRSFSTTRSTTLSRHTLRMLYTCGNTLRMLYTCGILYACSTSLLCALIRYACSTHAVLVWYALLYATQTLLMLY